MQVPVSNISPAVFSRWEPDHVTAKIINQIADEFEFEPSEVKKMIHGYYKAIALAIDMNDLPFITLPGLCRIEPNTRQMESHLRTLWKYKKFEKLEYIKNMIPVIRELKRKRKLSFTRKNSFNRWG